MSRQRDDEFNATTGAIESLIQGIEARGDAEFSATMRELVQALLTLHGAGLARVLEIVGALGAAGEVVAANLLKDELVSGLFLLHDLHPHDLESRVKGALEQSRPYLASHGGDVELIGIDAAGVVHLRLEGSCQGCPSSQVTLKYAIEEAIYKAAPDVTAIATEGAVPAAAAVAAAAPGYIPLSQLQGSAAPARPQGWVIVNGMAPLQEGAITSEDVAGTAVLFCKLDDIVYAYSSHCPHCRRPLADGGLSTRGLCCAGCGHSFDVRRAGRDLDQPGLHLEPYPLLYERGDLKVALHAAA